MRSKGRSKLFFAGALGSMLMLPTVAMAADSGNLDVFGSKIAAGLAMGLAAIAAGYAQAKIGSAGQGTLAERPEERIWVITLTALPEVIVLLGFVAAILLAGGE